ncbi:hypothetical protein SUGI_0478160 [Cryptomeria japonica]|nr:hypothetical protein SUGI_0478160 [Cryptomeria japonica]
MALKKSSSPRSNRYSVCSYSHPNALNRDEEGLIRYNSFEFKEIAREGINNLFCDDERRYLRSGLCTSLRTHPPERILYTLGIIGQKIEMRVHDKGEGCKFSARNNFSFLSVYGYTLGIEARFLNVQKI